MRKTHWPKMTLFNEVRYLWRAPDKILIFGAAAFKIVWIFIPRNVSSQLQMQNIFINKPFHYPSPRKNRTKQKTPPIHSGARATESTNLHLQDKWICPVLLFTKYLWLRTFPMIASDRLHQCCSGSEDEYASENYQRTKKTDPRWCRHTCRTCLWRVWIKLGEMQTEKKETYLNVLYFTTNCT